jgi:hypothetical protein
MFFPNKPVTVDGFGGREVQSVGDSLWYFPSWIGPITQQEWVLIVGDKISAVCIRILFSGSAVAGVLAAPQQTFASSATMAGNTDRGPAFPSERYASYRVDGPTAFFASDIQWLERSVIGSVISDALSCHYRIQDGRT